MWAEELSLKILGLIDDRDLWYRVAALDLETKVLKKEDFFTNERILGASIARRQSSGEINNVYFILDEETDEKEAELLQKLDEFLQKWKPLVVVGYGCRWYDLPLLTLKREYFHKKGTALWALRNLLVGSIHIELSELTRYIFLKKYEETRSYSDMSYVMKHEHFKDLPFKKTKDIYDLSKEQKGVKIYEDWKSGDKKFEEYLKGEAHDLLLIAERIRDTEF